MRKNKIVNGLVWKLLERFGVQGTQFVLQILLARILDPEHYGVLSMMVVFITLANVFIQRGFNTALIQNKEVTEEDYSSVFWITLSVAVLLYVVLFAAAPVIAFFYNMPDFVTPFRVLCIVLFPGALNSIQLAIISRRMEFKKVFYSNLAAIIVSGVTGIILAFCGAGLWALVGQNVLNTAIACVVMWFTVKWRPQLVCNIVRVKKLFSYGWKLLVSGLIDAVYTDLRSLVIGKKYDSGTLAYYNRGKQFPQFIINAVNTSVQSVLLPAMSAKQSDRMQLKTMMRTSITLSSYLIFPMMAGLAGISEPLVRMVLTEKWLPCVPYLRIYCFTLAFYPVHTCNLQAINAMGRSDVFLKLELIKKTMGIAALVIAVVYFNSPIAIAATGVVTGLINCFVNASPNKKLVDYSYKEQMIDIMPSALASLAMLCCVLALTMLNLSDMITIVIQIVAGVIFYVVLSVGFQLEPFKLLMRIVRDALHGKTKNEE